MYIHTHTHTHTQAHALVNTYAQVRTIASLTHLPGWRRISRARAFPSVFSPNTKTPSSTRVKIMLSWLATHTLTLSRSHICTIALLSDHTHSHTLSLTHTDSH